MKSKRPLKLDDYIVITIGLIVGFFLLNGVIFQSWAPKRSLVNTNNLTLLWSNEIEIDHPIVFSNDNNVIVYANKDLISFDLGNGSINWQIDIPTPIAIHKYEEQIYVTSTEKLLVAPNVGDQIFPSCSFGGIATLSAYDIKTGELVWGYRYLGVNSSDVSFFRTNGIFIGFRQSWCFKVDLKN